MLIDWFTVIAQILNFLVLVYLLKRFLYGPIIKAMDERERRIAARMEEAEEKKEEAHQEAERYQEKNRELDSQREVLLRQMKEEVEVERKELVSQARSQVDAIRANWYEAVKREKHAFLQNLRERTSKQTFDIARRALRDLANVDLEQHIVNVFVDRLRSLSDEEQAKLKESVQQSKARITVRSAFEIPEDMSSLIVNVLQAYASGPLDVQFEASSDVICGIELTAQGRKIAWSLGDYLEALETTLADVLTLDKGKASTQDASEKRGEGPHQQAKEVEE
ncbi:MAG: F0F1 ATP synthase subunit B [Thermodesulfobacteriota bacterium]|nr:F0F1 ATP synthase subunit B [Thermodesulfobacteriota bacterium]